MEVALRECGIIFETQRIIPVFYRENNREYCVGEAIPDLIVWVESETKRTAIVVDLKADQNIKEEHARQVQKYIESLEKRLKRNEEVHTKGLIINFAKGSGRQIPKKLFEEKEGPEIFSVEKSQNISEMLKKSEEKGRSNKKPVKKTGSEEDRR